MPERVGPDLLARSPEDGQVIAYSPGLARSVLLGTLTSSRMRVCHVDNGVANLVGYERFMYMRSAFVISFLPNAERTDFDLSGQSPGTFRHCKYAHEWEAYLAAHVSKLTAWQRAAMGPQSISPYLVEGAINNTFWGTAARQYGQVPMSVATYYFQNDKGTEQHLVRDSPSGGKYGRGQIWPVAEGAPGASTPRTWDEKGAYPVAFGYNAYPRPKGQNGSAEYSYLPTDSDTISAVREDQADDENVYHELQLPDDILATMGVQSNAEVEYDSMKKSHALVDNRWTFRFNVVLQKGLGTSSTREMFTIRSGHHERLMMADMPVDQYIMRCGEYPHCRNDSGVRFFALDTKMWVVLSNLENNEELYWKLRTGNLGWDLIEYVKKHAPHVQAVVHDGYVIGGGGAGAVLAPGPHAFAEGQAHADHDDFGMH